jgi:hypothetical protein
MGEAVLAGIIEGAGLRVGCGLAVLGEEAFT